MADTLTITDNRTGKHYEIPITDGTIRAMDLRQIKVASDEFGMMTYDPAFMNTASCRSRITFIDGDNGVLLYRGYPIEQLAEHSDFLETAYLILFGELPTDAQQERWTRDITRHTMLHTNISKLMEGFQYDAHPMGMFISTVGALSTFYSDAKDIFSAESRRLQTIRLIAKVPTIAAYAFRHSIGRPYNLPDNDLSYAGNFLNMLFRMTEMRYTVNPVLERALDVLFILHADHEQNCSTSSMRNIGSSHADPYSCARRRGGGALRAAAWRCQRGSAADAHRDWLDQQRAGVHQAGERRRRPAHGLRPSRLQVRTTRAPRSSSGLPTWYSTSPARTRCCRSRSSSNASPWSTTTSSPASCIRTSTSTPA